MKKVSHNITAYAFLLLVAIPMFVPLLHFANQLDIKEQMKELLQQRPLQTVRVAARDVVWMDKHEIWVNEQMFDIVSSKLADGVYSFTGLYDEAETNIVKKQMEAGKDDNDEKQRQQIVMKWLNNAWIPADDKVHCLIIRKKLSYPELSGIIPDVITSVVTPPPRHCVPHKV